MVSANATFVIGPVTTSVIGKPFAARRVRTRKFTAFAREALTRGFGNGMPPRPVVP